jgi:23S rRNA (adenine2503-C2)-methyltransferase
MNLDKLKEILDKLEEPTYRFKQIKLAVYRDLKEGFSFVDNIPQGLRESLTKLLPFNELTLKTEQKSLDGTVKKLFLTNDNLAIESVLIKHEDLRRTVCVSTEAGCQINCSFCATGHLGFKRGLTSFEIFEQVLAFARELKIKNEKVTNVVFMGMGEPFLNYINVKEAILLLNDKEGFNLGQRHISVSTSGIIPGIKSFTEENWQINLAISLHAPNNVLRSELMPINNTYPIEELMAALDTYVLKTNRRLMIEYLLLGGINDDAKEAEALADLIHSYKNISRLSLVNLIIYNPTKDNYGHWDKFKAPSSLTLKKFEEILTKKGINWTRRVSFGSEIAGACGQLAGQEEQAK